MSGLRILALSLVWAAIGCASSLKPVLVASPQSLRPDPADYPDDDAVVLQREVKGLLVRPRSGPDRSQWLYHEVVAVLTERGRDRVDFRLPFNRDTKIIGFEARTISPTGQITPVSQDEIKDDEGRSSDDTGYRVRTFAFPKVEVGSIVEFSVVTEVPGLTSSSFNFISGDFPTKSYRVEVEGTSDIYYSVKSYNVKGAEPWSVENAGVGWRLKWGIDDVAAKSKEAFRGPAKAHEPYWLFSVKAVGGSGGQVFQWNANWANSYEYRAKELYKKRDDYFKDTDIKVDMSSCQDARCKVVTALDWLKTKLPFRGFTGYPGRKAKKVLNNGEASDSEKARILHKVLADHGIESRFAFYHQYLNGRVDKEFPERSSMRNLLVYVPKQNGLDAPLWIDPVCEYCALGQLPAWLRDTEALLIDYEYEGMDTQPTWKAEFVPVTGQGFPKRTWTGRYAATVAENGTVDVKFEIERKGPFAQKAYRWIRKDSDEKWQTTATNVVKARIKSAQVVAQKPYVFDSATWTARRALEFRAEQFAVKDGDTMILPLSFLNLGFDDDFKSDKRTRPVYLRWPTDDHEIVDIAAPPGYVVKTTPSSAEKSGPISVRIEVTNTERTVRIHRSVRVTPGRYEPASYSEIRAAVELLRGIKSEAVTFERAAVSSR